MQKSCTNNIQFKTIYLTNPSGHNSYACIKKDPRMAINPRMAIKVKFKLGCIEKKPI